MKKLLFLLLIIFTIFTLALSSFKIGILSSEAEVANFIIDRNSYINNDSYSDMNDQYALNYYSYIYMYEFQKLFPDRTPNSENEKKAAEYLADKFKDLGLENKTTKYLQKVYGKSDFIGYENVDTNNVIGVKKAATETDKQVIIGAHYDNAYKILQNETEKDTSTEGAFDNGSGIATMLALIELLKDKTFDYNIVFIAFGAEEIGSFGSKSYANNMSKSEIDNTLLMINLESISGGDNLYLYCDEFETEHESFISSNMRPDLLTAKPKNMGVAMSANYQNPDSYEDFRYPYYHNGLISDNVPFLLKGINTAFFFSGYWNDNSDIEDEAKSRGDIRYTENDNLQKLEELYGEAVYSRMDNLALSITDVLSKNDFSSVMNSSKENKKDYRYLINYKVINIIYYVIKGIFIFIVVLIAIKLNKKRHATGGGEEEKTIYQTNTKKEESVFKDFDI